MKKDFCEIVMVLDESGSMNSCKTDTIGGVNEFLNNQKRINGQVNVTLIKFSNYYVVVNDAVPLDQVVYLDVTNYIPSNTTALLDAVGKAVNTVGARLSNTPEEDRPEKVIFVVITDGYENASKEFTRRQVFELVSRQRDVYKWEFIFLGADIDAWGEEIGIKRNVRIPKDNLSRSFKGLSLFTLNARMFGSFEDDETFNMTEDQMDQRLKDVDQD
jgi:uncharacterized protein YegL